MKPRRNAGRRISPDEANEMVKLRLRGESLKGIAAALGTTPVTVMKHLRRRGYGDPLWAKVKKERKESDDQGA